jgi:hypothetical protein
MSSAYADDMTVSTYADETRLRADTGRALLNYG